MSTQSGPPCSKTFSLALNHLVRLLAGDAGHDDDGVPGVSANGDARVRLLLGRRELALQGADRTALEHGYSMKEHLVIGMAQLWFYIRYPLLLMEGAK